MTRAWLVALVCALAFAGCGDDDDVGVRDAAADAAAGGSSARTDGGRMLRDGALAPADASPAGDAPAADTGTDAAAVAACADDDDAGEAGQPLTIEAPAEAPLGLPFTVAVSAAAGSALSTSATLCVDGEPAGELRLYRGRGSAQLTLAQPGPVVLRVRAPEAHGERMLIAATRPEQRVTGALSGAEIRWSADSDWVLAGDVQVPAGTTLTVEAGARVLLEDRASLQVSGTLRMLGSAEAPVLVTRAGEAAWGGIELLTGARGELEHAWFTGGGGDANRAFGHSDSQPVIWILEATLEMRAGGVVDNPGKAFGSRSATISLQGVLVSRCDTGGELRDSQVTIADGYVLEMPDADGRFDDDDNDGIYMLGALVDADGAPIESLIRDSVFAVGEDDAIDHNGALLRVERVWIEGFRHEGLAGSDALRLTLVDSVVRGCEQGVEAGYGAPEVIVEHSLITDNRVGLRFGDNYDRATAGSLTVRHSISVGNHDANVRNHVNQLGGPLEGAIDIGCSMVDSADYDGQAGNLPGMPTGAWQARGCADAPDLTGSGCDGTPPGPRVCF